MIYKFFVSRFLSFLAGAASITATIGAGSASSWGDFQAKLPKELIRRR